jgi:hypothetical protein
MVGLGPDPDRIRQMPFHAVPRVSRVTYISRRLRKMRPGELIR